MLRRPEEYLIHVSKTIEECLQEGERKHPQRIKVSIGGNAEMLQDRFQYTADKVLKKHNCVFTKNVFAIYDDDGDGQGWTSITFSFMKEEHLEDYLKGIEKDHREEVNKLQHEIELLEEKLYAKNGK